MTPTASETHTLAYAINSQSTTSRYNMAKMDTLPARQLKLRVCLLLVSKGFYPIDELTLPNKRRLDVCGVDARGGIIGVETKVAEGDLRQDEKWTDYLSWVDTFYFAINQDLPQQFVHNNVGLIISNKRGAWIVRTCPRSHLATDRRIEMLAYFAKICSQRLRDGTDWKTYHNAAQEESNTQQSEEQNVDQTRLTNQKGPIA